jgi:acyl-CoA thioester hydrolase
VNTSEPIVTLRGAVYPWHCDHMGHMNVMWYVGRFDEATWCLFAASGITPSYLRDEGRGMVAVEQHVTYRREVLAGDVIIVRSRLLEVREKSMRLRHEMLKGESDEMVAETAIVGVHIDRTTRRSVPFPEDLLARMRSAVPPSSQ